MSFDFSSYKEEKEKFDFSSYREEEKPIAKESTISEDLLGGFLQTGHLGATSLEAAGYTILDQLSKTPSLLLPSLLAKSFSEAKEVLIKNTMERKDYLERKGPLANRVQGAGGKVLSAVASLPYLLNPLTAPLVIVGSGVDTGIDILRDGGSLNAALSGQAVDTGLALGAVAVPASIIKGIVANALATGTLNVGQEIANRHLQNAIRTNEGIRKLPDFDTGDALASFIPGAAIGALVAKPKIQGQSRFDGTSDLVTESKTKFQIEESQLIKTQMDAISSRMEAIRALPPGTEDIKEIQSKIPSLEKDYTSLAEKYIELTDPVKWAEYLKLKEAADLGADVDPRNGLSLKGQYMTTQGQYTSPLAAYVSQTKNLHRIEGILSSLNSKLGDLRITGDTHDLDSKYKRAFFVKQKLEDNLEKLESKLVLDYEFTQKQLGDIRTKIQDNIVKKTTIHDGIDLFQRGNAKLEATLDFLHDNITSKEFVEIFFKRELDTVSKDSIQFVGNFPQITKNLSKIIGKITGLSSEKLILIDGRKLPHEVQQKYATQGEYFMFPKDIIILNPEKYNTLFKNEPTRKILETHFGSRLLDYKNFKEAYVLAHELGHFYMSKLIKYGFLNYDLSAQTAIKLRTYLENQNIKVTDLQLSPHIYMNRFGEFFADQFLNKMLFKQSPIAEIGNKISRIFQAIVDKFKLGNQLRVEEMMDNLLNGFLEKNSRALKLAGKTMFEYQMDKYSNKILSDYQHSKNLGDIYNLKVLDDGSNIIDPTAGVPLKPAEMVVKEMSGTPDIGAFSLKQFPNLFKKLVNFTANSLEKGALNFFGDQQFSRIYAENPLIKEVYSVLRHAEDVATSMKKHLLFGPSKTDTLPQVGPFRKLTRQATKNSLEYQIKHATDSDILTVWNALEKGFTQKLPYKETLRQFGSTFTESQHQLFHVLTDTWTRQYEYVRKAQETLDKKNILPFREGWIPAVRNGDFYVTLLMDTIPVHVEAFRTKYEANNFIKQVSEQNFKSVKVSDVVDVSEVKRRVGDDYQFAFELADSISKQLANIHRDPSIEITTQEILTRIRERGGKLSGHHEFRQGFSGYLGSRLFKNNTDTVLDVRDAIRSSIDAYTTGVKRLYINTNTADLLDTPNGLDKTHPNAFNAVKLMRDMATKSVIPWTDGFDKTVRNVFDKIAASFDSYPKANSLDVLQGTMSHAFYLFTLTSRPGFWLAQALSSPLAMREFLRSDNIFSAMDSFGRGTWNVMTGGNIEFRKAINYIANNFDTFHPQFINEINKFPIIGDSGNRWAKNIFDWLSGEKISNTADSFSRYHAAASFYEHFKKKGLQGKELYLAIAEATDANMVTYSKSHKPPILNKLGITGDAIAPLQTFAAAQLGNLVGDFRAFAKNPAMKTAMPFIATTIITSFLGGIIGAPLVAEYELLRKLLISLDDSYEDKIPSVVEWALAGDNRLLSHGAASAATGFDVGSGLRWNQIISGVVTGNKTLIELFPAIAFTKDMVSSLGTFVRDATKHDIPFAEERKAGLRFFPGGYKGVADDLLFKATERDMVPGGGRGYGIVPQTDKERASTYIGSKTLEYARESKIHQIEKEKEERRREKIQTGMDLLMDGISQNRPRKVEVAIKKLVDLGVPQEQIKEQIDTIAGKRATPLLQRFGSGQKGTVTTDEQRRKTMNILEYEQ